MTNPDGPPVPPQHPGAGFPRTTGPDKSLPIADVRAEFEQLSRQAPRDPEAEQAFIESKIAIIRTDPNMTKADKQRAIDELGRGP
jgi:hypothetical protein